MQKIFKTQKKRALGKLFIKKNFNFALTVKVKLHLTLVY